MSEIFAIYKGMCPNCHGDIISTRLKDGLPCKKCLPSVPSNYKNNLDGKKLILKKLEEYGTLQDYKRHVEFIEETQNVFKFVEEVSGKKLWSAQRTWVKRILLGRSFSITAPTGTGKTFFLMNMAIYLALKKKKKIYFILPTVTLVDQVYKNMKAIQKSKKKQDISLVRYHANLSKNEKTKALEAINNASFDILITTSQFLAKSFDKIENIKFDYIFVDDVDSVLKASKNIDRLLVLSGFSKEIVSKALELIRLKVNLAKSVRTKTSKDQITALKSKINDLAQEIAKEKEEMKLGVLVVSSATAKPKGLRVKLFRELLDFEIGGVSEGLRRVYDTYLIVPDEKMYYKQILDFVKKFGKGGLIFVPKDKGIEEAEKVAKLLRNIKVKAAAFHTETKLEILEDFANGKIDILVGVATTQGRLVRGIDLPERIRYAIFLGIPRFIYYFKDVKISPYALITILTIIGESTNNEDLIKKARMLRDKLKQIGPSAVRTLIQSIEKDEPVEGYLATLKTEIANISKDVLKLLRRPIIRKQISEYPYARIKDYDGGIMVIYPDITTYIQASGRTSRLYAGGVTRGLSLVMDTDQFLINGLRRQLLFRFENADLLPINEVDIKSILEEIDADREAVKRIYKEPSKVTDFDPIKTAAFVVESPNKARTIANFFGTPTIHRFAKGINVYEVNTGEYIINIIATKGHIFDLVNSVGHHGILYEDGKFVPVYDTIKRCKSCNTQFVEGDACPNCGSTNFTNSLKIIKQLQKLAREVDYLFLALDPDTEGEKIAWDVGINISHIISQQLRAEFHEVSKSAIDKSISEPEKINESLVKSQIVRRVEDRWIGYELSQRLWEMFRQTGLSAGRVQSALLRWIIKRYEEWKKDLHYYYRLEFNGFSIVIDYPNIKTITEGKAKARQLESAIFEVKDVKSISKIIQPPAPYTTDTMLSEVSSVLKMSPTEIMQLAQDLFEAGLITYHRTDSTRVSPQGFKIAKTYISQKYGENEYLPRQWGYLGAHECIRPVRPIDKEQLIDLLKEGVIKTVQPITPKHIALYNMIFRRFMASQMYPATIEMQKVKGRVNDKIVEIEGLRQIIKAGFTQEYKWNLPKQIATFTKNQTFKVINVKHWLSSSIKLYTQAELVREMKERGIGRPSTYAVMIKKLFDRKYIKEENGWIKPTLLGVRVGNYLSSRYRRLVSDERTKELYDKMKKIEEGHMDYQSVLRETFNELNEILHQK